MNKIGLLIKEIEKSAIEYGNKLEGNCYLYIYQDKCFEVYFARDCFRHLTGVNSTVTANDFYLQAQQNRLNQNVINFGNDDIRTCLKKARHLSDLYKLTITDTIVIEDVHTKYMEFEIGITNLKLTLLLHENGFIKDKTGKIISDIYLPSSFRVGDNPMALAQAYETIDCVLQKKFGDVEYSTIVFQDECFDMRKLPDYVKQKISKELVENEIEYENAMDEPGEMQDICEEEIEYINKLAVVLFEKNNENLTREEFVNIYLEKVKNEGVNQVIAELKDELKELNNKEVQSEIVKESEKTIE